MNAAERSQIQQIVEQKQIQHLFHFTPLDNLASILENGLCSRNGMLLHDAIDGVCLDNVRADNKLDFISVSVSFPNSSMFFARRQNNERTWAVISLSPSLLWEITDREIQFFDTNAAYQKFRGMSDKELQSADAFLSLFADSITNKKDGILTRDNRLLPKDPTDVQAEIMVERYIETRYINKIFFNNQNIVNELSQQYPNLEFGVASQLFNNREYSRQNGWHT